MKNVGLIFLGCCLLLQFSSCRVSKKKKQKYIVGFYHELKDSFINSELTLIEDSIKMVFPDDIIFDLGSAQIKESFIEKLSKLSKLVNKYEKTNILVTGHTDNTGEGEVNDRLSKFRAESVRHRMVEYAVRMKRIFVWGQGSRVPRSPNDTEEGKARNRRGEFVLLYAEVN